MRDRVAECGLADALRENSTLQQLDLSGNGNGSGYGNANGNSNGNGNRNRNGKGNGNGSRNPYHHRHRHRHRSRLRAFSSGASGFTTVVWGVSPTGSQPPLGLSLSSF